MGTLIAIAITIYLAGIIVSLTVAFLNLIDDGDPRVGLELIKGGFLVWPIFAARLTASLIREAEADLKRQEELREDIERWRDQR